MSWVNLFVTSNPKTVSDFVGVDDLSLDLQLKVLKRLQNEFLYGPEGLS
jgi:hypothetical protein